MLVTRVRLPACAVSCLIGESDGIPPLGGLTHGCEVDFSNLVFYGECVCVCGWGWEQKAPPLGGLLWHAGGRPMDFGNLVFYGGCVGWGGGRKPPHFEVCSCMLGAWPMEGWRAACLPTSRFDLASWWVLGRWVSATLSFTEGVLLGVGAESLPTSRFALACLVLGRWVSAALSFTEGVLAGVGAESLPTSRFDLACLVLGRWISTTLSFTEGVFAGMGGRGPPHFEVGSCMLVAGQWSSATLSLREGGCVVGVRGRKPPHFEVGSCMLVAGQWVSATLCSKEGSPPRHLVLYEEVLGKLLQGFQDSRIAQSQKRM